MGRIILDPEGLASSAQRLLDLSVAVNRYRLQLSTAASSLPAMPAEVRARVASELGDIQAALLRISRAEAGSLGFMHRELKITARALGAPGPKIEKLSRWWKVGDAVVATGDFFGANVLAYTVMGEKEKAAGQAGSFVLTVFGGHILKGVGKGGKAAMRAGSSGAKAAGRALTAGSAMALVGRVAGRVSSAASSAMAALAQSGRAMSRWAHGVGRLRPDRAKWNAADGRRLERIAQATHQGFPYLVHPANFRHPLLVKLAKRPRPELPPLAPGATSTQRNIQGRIDRYLRQHYRTRSFYANGDFRAAALMEIATGVRGAHINRWATFAQPTKNWKDHIEKVAVARRFLDNLLRTEGTAMTHHQRALVQQELRLTDEALEEMLKIWQSARPEGLSGAALQNYRDIENALELATK